ncbi:hypothetical protein VCRA2116O29_160005 [Vibrio crassostreae]|nr:hypothetical protein VCRA2113O217_250033 [Vibrio crassostreae]CAK2412816.1 hypothetical protein VCRA2116O29_160005 [Vibrio crassostreae]CAK2463769.1 hypothetical protein VCRA2113O226_240032 [Vibrio crassostreae]CAK2812068.1 hypothetical protein VCRA2119O124_280031 [Vibrio crassostreae]CAK2894004.1 hypothetical protein VCRA217O134_270030 [Vibrio crassostreae]
MKNLGEFDDKIRVVALFWHILLCDKKAVKLT